MSLFKAFEDAGEEVAASDANLPDFGVFWTETDSEALRNDDERRKQLAPDQRTLAEKARRTEV